MYSLSQINNPDDLSQMKRFTIDRQIYEVYKFLKVKTLKRPIIFKSNIKGQWPNLYNAGNGICFDNALELDNISNNLMIIWTPMMDKGFKIGLEGTLKARVEKDITCNFAELSKKTRRKYGLGVDTAITDLLGVEYPHDEYASQHKKSLWLARARQSRRIKSGKFSDLNVIIEVGEAEILIGAKIYSLWDVEAMNLYLNMLAGLKNRSFIIIINGIVWNDKMSIGSKKLQTIRAIPDQFNVIQSVMGIVNLSDLNMHSIMLKHNGQFLNLTAPKSVTLGQAIAM
jgi:hypothetical protein